MANVLAVVKRLTASGFSEVQAEAVVEAIADMQENLATRSDLQVQSAEFRSDMQAQTTEFRSEMAALRSDMQEQTAEHRSEMAALRSDMQKQMASLRSDMQEQMTALRSDMQAQAAEHRSEMQVLELRLTIRIGAVVGATSLVTTGVLAALIALL